MASPGHDASSTASSVASEVGAFIRDRRQARGMTVKELADAVGVGRPYMSHVEAGRKTPREDLGLKIAAALHEDPEAIFSRLNIARLPGRLRKRAPEPDTRLSFEAARLYLLRQFDYQVERLTVTLTANRFGDVKVVRLYEGLRPIPGGPPLRVLKFSERAGTPDRPQAPKLREIETPEGVIYHVHTETRPGLVHRRRIEFPGPGWSIRSADATNGLTFEIEIARKKALSVDEELGAFVHLCVHPVQRLRLVLEFTPGALPPQQWLPAAAWLGGGEYDEETANAIELLARKAVLSRTEHGAILEVDEPLPQASFAIAWRMTQTASKEAS